jgi:hypothetical protein
MNDARNCGRRSLGDMEECPIGCEMRQTSCRDVRFEACLAKDMLYSYPESLRYLRETFVGAFKLQVQLELEPPESTGHGV